MTEVLTIVVLLVILAVVYAFRKWNEQIAFDQEWEAAKSEFRLYLCPVCLRPLGNGHVHGVRINPPPVGPPPAAPSPPSSVAQRSVR
jgi:hypothetical protein